jgi:nucleoside-diphosphate-sugar epimerase
LKLIKNKKSYGKYINICSGKSVKTKKILEYMILLSNENIEIISENASQKNQDMNIYFGDNKKLIQLIGDFKFIPWKKTVKKMMF